MWLDLIANAFSFITLAYVALYHNTRPVVLSPFLLFMSWELEGSHDAYGLLGDSVIDNKAHVGRGPDVTASADLCRTNGRDPIGNRWRRYLNHFQSA